METEIREHVGATQEERSDSIEWKQQPHPPSKRETPWQGALGILKTTLLVSGNLPDNFSAGSRLDFLCEHLRGPQELLKVSEMEFFWLPNSLL
jgi:hypothetical protein